MLRVDHSRGARSDVLAPHAPLPDAPVTAVRLRVFRSAVEGVAMSFAPMTHRTMAVVEVELADGSRGLGETWVNYPAWAWHERRATVHEGLSPLLVGRTFATTAQAHDHLMAALSPLGRQWGAPGPVHQAVSGVDTALWDLAARSTGVPLGQLLAPGATRGELPVYASGLGPGEVHQTARACLVRGHRAVKLKVGFDPQTDLSNLRAAREALGDDVQLFVDANQGWTFEEAVEMAPAVRDAGVAWWEEPLRGDDPRQLAELRQHTGIPVATGENLYSADAFAALVDLGAADVLQPDLSKVGGPTAYLRIVQRAAGSGVAINPHLYNGAVATAATVQVAAAVPATTLVEWDVRDNPLRAPIDHLLTDHGTVTVPDHPGLGVEIDLAGLAEHEEMPWTTR